MIAATEHWRPGEPRLLRHVHGAFVRYAIPVTVVEDSCDRIALFLREGTPLRWTTGLQALTFPGTAPETRRWQSTNVLMLVEPPQAAHSTWLMWSATSGAFLGWYVNLQRPLTRTELGFDTWDQSLDIVVSPRLTWCWKDEDEFMEVQRLGILDATEAAAVRAEAQSVIKRIDGRQAPFSADWPSWRPNPHWPSPRMPANWSMVR